MADSGSKSDPDSASVDTLLEGVLGGDVQSAKARAPKRAREEAAPGVSVIVEDEPIGGAAGGRRKPFLSEEEEIARLAPTVPPATRKREIPRDTVVDEGAAGENGGPLAAKRRLPAWAVVIIALLACVAAFAASRVISADVRREAAGPTAVPTAANTATPLSSAAAMVATAASAMPTGTAPAPSVAASATTTAAPVSPPSTYGHLVPGGRH